MHSAFIEKSMTEHMISIHYCCLKFNFNQLFNYNSLLILNICDVNFIMISILMIPIK